MDYDGPLGAEHYRQAKETYHALKQEGKWPTFISRHFLGFGYEEEGLVDRVVEGVDAISMDADDMSFTEKPTILGTVSS